jgi:hypothetical protein
MAKKKQKNNRGRPKGALGSRKWTKQECHDRLDDAQRAINKARAYLESLEDEALKLPTKSTEQFVKWVLAIMTGWADGADADESAA